MSTPNESTELRREIVDGVLVLTFDGPRSRNSIGPEIYEQLQAEVITAGQDRAIRAIVLTGGNGFFSSGGNVRALQESAKSTLADCVKRTDKLNTMIQAISESEIPVIAAVEGGAAGLGVSIALACDMVVASEAAKFTVAYVKIGLTPDGATTWLLRSALPRQLVTEMCALARPVTAERLEQFGLVNVVAPAGGALNAAMALAREVAAGPAQAIRQVRAEITAAPKNDLATHLKMEADGINRARFGAEAAEGLAAFLEKRKPDFSDITDG